MRFAIGSTDYRVNDQAQTMDTAAVIKEERTLLPIRYVATPLGASVDWKAEEKKAVISINGKTIELRAGQNTALVNGVEVMIDPGNMNVSPEVVPPGRIILPLRFIAENLGCEVEWDSDRRTVTVTGAKP
ncbi:MAG: copper amine oxidase N-terminal domain-containing protein [Firmicutes bacterium]|nr:copper amine oxidase N-terminal domain-containing protein [Bacillota bacterium]